MTENRKKQRTRTRANGEGSIFPYRNGYAAYVWVTTPSGERKKKWVYGKTRDDVHNKYVKLHHEAQQGRVSTKIPTLEKRIAYWLESVVVEPDYAPLAIVTYETFTRLYILPYLGKKRLDKLSVGEVRKWVNTLRQTCQCCAQGKDARRPEKHWNPKRRRHCCAVGQCCRQVLKESTVQKALKILRAILSNAVSEEIISKNVATSVRLSTPRKRKVKPWSVEEARRFLESARDNEDPLYAAYVLILVLGLRKGEVLGLDWKYVDLEAGEIYVGEQLQRVRQQLLRRQVKTDSSEAPLPLPAICTAALQLRKEQQERDRRDNSNWRDTGLVFTGPAGSPIEPAGGFNRRFDTAIERAGVRRITVHTTRGTCATLLAALDVHPRVAMRILRHSNIKMTMEVYTDATDEATCEALRRLGSVLDQPRNDGQE
ncbi:tyrosine-type recombinase/integrase [Sphaerisporangium fuscum]|uniref:tyrosine-type recombinase/integrase n=1 Tax=Sphaerisporangium fuscum TaxID=2835868 RepID=UPI001BDCC0FF|nr:site-specific integrase [Sphaerisporangium fuscum]